MISQTSEYVLRALVHLASRGNSEPVLAREIAEKAEIPRNYLSKLLYELRRAGLVESVRGKSGGYTLAVDPGSVRIADILDRFDGPGDYEKCFLRRASCDARKPCPVHHRWKPIAERIKRFVEETTLADMAG
jgi:Rrf2 family protein